MPCPHAVGRKCPLKAPVHKVSASALALRATAARAGPERVTRRRLLSLVADASALALGGWARPGWAIGPRSEVGIGRLRHGAAWDARPEALRRLLWETGKRTSIQAARDATALSLEDEELFYQPLLVWTGSGDVPPLTERARARLARYLRFGGMLWVDAPAPDDPFAAAARREIAAALPDESLGPMGADHVLFRSFFLLESTAGRLRDDRPAEALLLAGRAAVLFTACDVLGAYERDRFGTWRFECVPGGESQREQAFRFGVNVLMYATCLDYKADQVHIPFIMKKTRR